jgi:Fe-S-cluster-containing dehydrogenase component
MLIDQERCIGCDACTVACQKENRGSQGWIQVITQEVPHKDTPAGTFPDLKMHFLPRICQHCDQPPCADACPLDIITKRDDGLVFMDIDACDGCQTCVDACPYEAIVFNGDKDKAEKCNLCAHRIEQGLEPFCVICCEGQAILFGDLNDPNSQISKAIASGQTIQLKKDAGTGPGVFYSPPKAPRGL